MSRQIASTSSRACRPEAIRLPATPAPTIRMRGGRSVIAGLSSSAFRSGTLGDEGDEAAAVGALMLGAPGHEDCGVVEHAGDDRADRRTDVALLVNVAIIEHGVRLAAHEPVPRRLALDEACANEARVLRGKLRACPGSQDRPGRGGRRRRRARRRGYRGR